MKTKIITLIAFAALWLLFPVFSAAQDKEWTLADCIDYALHENISVRKANVNTNIGEINLRQVKNNRLPDISASVREGFSWSSENPDTISNLKRSNSTSLSLNSGVTLFNGFKMKNNIRQAEINYQALKYDTEVTKENVSLNLLNAYLQVLYSEELVTNSQNQVDATTAELQLAAERVRLGAISNADYLQVKTQLASEKLTLANAKNSYDINKVTLMQYMELPISDSFKIARPDIDSIINLVQVPLSSDIYAEALQVKPGIKSATLATEESQVNLELAKGGYWPSISADAGINTNMSASKSVIAGSQLTNNISPSAGISVSIPIFSKWSNKTNVSTAKANITMAQLNELDVKNQLRKNIEQACLDARSAVIQYEANQFSYEAAKESFNVAEEKYNQGLMNSIDFLTVKTSLITSESELLQAKYQVIYSFKIIDFYKGIPLSL